MNRVAIALMVVLAAAGCRKESASASAAPTSPSPKSAAHAPAPANALAGQVLETFDGGGYTYLRISTPAGEQWAAVRETKVKSGDRVEVVPQMTMEKFHSNTLDRTFETIVFGVMADEMASGGTAMQAKLPEGHPAPAGGTTSAMTRAMGSASEHMKSAETGDVKVEKATGGKTVAEVWAGRASLGGKEVVVRGRVVKFLGGIMGTNWMHLRDGSGSTEKGDHDLTVTTDQVAAVGDVVTVRGTLSVDKDFGSGYRYPAIVEKASVTK